MSRIVLCVVDNSAELEAAVHYACLYARKREEEVGLLYVIEPGDFQHFMMVESLVKEERRAEAELALQKWTMVVEGLTGGRPVTYIRQGEAADELTALIDEETDIIHLVLAAAGGDTPGPLLVQLATRGLSKLRVPVTIIPGTLEKAALQQLA
jgi:nucleotide-binding universal stress UspA family protein